VTDEREARLPAWVRELLGHLRREVATGRDPLLRELSVLRPQLDKVRAINEALTELLQCAAKGGHMTAGEIVAVIESYTPWEE
jgi:hypothetical protein